MFLQNKAAVAFTLHKFPYNLAQMRAAVVSAKMAAFSNANRATQISEISPLTAISPIDGRYAKSCHSLRPYFSEFALMRFRVFVELSWFKTLFSQQIVTSDANTIAQVQAQ